MKKRSDTKATDAAKPSTAKIKKDKEPKDIFWVGSAQKVSAGCSSRSEGKSFWNENDMNGS